MVFKKLAMAMLSVPALVKKNSATLFLPGKALFMDLEEDLNILITAVQEEDGLFYISDQQDSVPKVPKTYYHAMRSMMAIAKAQHGSPEYEEIYMDDKKDKREQRNERKKNYHNTDKPFAKKIKPNFGIFAWAMPLMYEQVSLTSKMVFCANPAVRTTPSRILHEASTVENSTGH